MDQEQHAPLVCTVLPTFNEAGNIEKLIRGIVENAITPHMVLVVDDDSPDGTWRIVQKVADKLNTSDHLKVALIRRTWTHGLTSAIQLGIDTALYTFGANIVTWMDCDLSMPPEDVPRLVQEITASNQDLAAGSRWIPGGADVAHGFMARSLSWIINAFAMLLLGSDIHDYTSGFIAARSEVFRHIRLHGDYGEYCIRLLTEAKRAGYHLVEVSYVCVPRSSGESKTGENLLDYLTKGRKYVQTILKLAMQRR